MLASMRNIFKVPDLRTKILFTITILALYRVGSQIPVPGIDFDQVVVLRNNADTAGGVFATASAGAAPYPMIPFMGLLHSALGDELSGFLQGTESAEQALADVEAAYTAAAKEQGFLQ